MALSIGIVVSFESLHEPLERVRIVTNPIPRNGTVAGSILYLLVFKHHRGQDQCGQVTKGMWGMSWRQEAMKGVEDCEKPGGAVKRALIPGCPNHPALNP